MTRYSFGGGTADYVISTTGAPVPNAQITHWSALTGGTQYTDLRESDGTTVISGGIITCDAYGSWRTFLGPDETKSMFVQAGAGPRRRVAAVDVTVTPVQVPAGASIADVVCMDATGAWPSAYTAAADRAILAIIHPDYVGQSSVAVPNAWSTTAKALAIYPERTVATAPDLTLSAPVVNLLAATFTAVASSTSGGSIASYAWTFGDGATGAGASVSHTYSAAGSYTVTCTVTDSAGLTTAKSTSVTVTLPSGVDPGPMGFPSRAIEGYQFMYTAGSGDMRTVSTDFNVLIIAFAAQLNGTDLRIVDWTSIGKTAFIAEIKARRAAGCRVMLGIGGGGNPIKGVGGTYQGAAMPINTAKMIADIKWIISDLGTPLDGLDWDVEHNVDATAVATISKALADTYPGFVSSLSIGGIGSYNDTLNRINAAKAIQDKGCLSRLAFQCYDWDGWAATSWYQTLLSTYQDFLNKGITVDHTAIGMMVGAGATYWTLAKCQTAATQLLADLGVHGAALWETNRADTTQWAADMKSIYGTGGSVTNPTASFTQTLTGNTVAVDASASTAPGASITSYAWTWGDGTSTSGSSTTGGGGTAGAKALEILGPTKSGLPWHSGAWVAGPWVVNGVDNGVARAVGFGAWRGRPLDFTVGYVNNQTGGEAGLMNSGWNANLWNGFDGKLAYGVSMIPPSADGSWSLSAVAAGNKDYVFQKIADDLIAAGRGDTILRIGWEANLNDWPWKVTIANATTWKSAFQRIVTVMRAKSPNFKIAWGTALGSGVTGGSDRLDIFTYCYPGDAYVDIVEFDTYDFYNTNANTEAEWSNFLAPSAGPGLTDLVTFARAHNKGAGLGEWGCHAGPSTPNAGGDNPFLVQKMWDFFVANRDVWTYEAYFSESDDYIANSLWNPTQLVNAAAKYKQLWAAGTSGNTGGGTTTPTVTTSHIYAAAGTYTIGLTITASNGLTASTTHSVTVGTPSGGPSGTILLAEGYTTAETEAQFLARAADNKVDGNVVGTLTVTPSKWSSGGRAFSPSTTGLSSAYSTTSYALLMYNTTAQNRSLYFRLTNSTANPTGFIASVKASGDWNNHFAAVVSGGNVSLSVRVNQSPQANTAGTIPWVTGHWYRLDAVAITGGYRLTLTDLTSSATITLTTSTVITSTTSWLWWPEGGAATLTGMAIAGL